MIKLRAAILIAITGLLTACDWGTESGADPNKQIIARVYEDYLYREDLEKIVPEELSGEDSLGFVQNYINVWARNKLLVYKAEFNLTEEQKRFEEKIEKYRNDLLKYAYLEKYVKENLDTAISQREIRSYYQENKATFSLKENILQMRYLAMPQEATDAEQIKKLFRQADSADLAELRNYSLNYAHFYPNEDSAWISFDDFTNLVPVQTFNQVAFLEENTYLEIEEEGMVYLVEIMDYKMKNSPSPLPYVYNIIQNILLNRKRLALIEELERSLLNDALKKKAFETY